VKQIERDAGGAIIGVKPGMIVSTEPRALSLGHLKPALSVVLG